MIEAQERPRARLKAHGPEALTDAELVSIFIRRPATDAVQMARQMLASYGTLSATIHGAGQPEMTAALELARRTLRGVR